MIRSALAAGLAGLLAAMASPAAGEAPARPGSADRARQQQKAHAELLERALSPGRIRLVDLTHPLDARTLVWPTSPVRFQHHRLHRGRTPAGYYYADGRFSSPEHGGTHLDAPIHFAEGKQTADQVPLERLIGPVAVIDVSAQAQRDPDYRLGLADVREHEQRFGTLGPGTLVLLRTGWSSRWPDRRRYLGDDTPGDASRLHFPSFGPEAVRFLVETRRVAGIGVDTASIDHGPSRDFPVHRIVGAANVPAFENLTGLQALPARGAFLIALPVKLADGSGAPLRAVALVPR